MKRFGLYLISILIGSVHLSAQQVTEIAIVDDESVVVDSIDVLPQYKGGQEALFKALSENLVYPAECAEANIQGSVLVQFIVSTKGQVKDIQVIRSVHPLLDAEAVRVVRMLDGWEPAMKDGNAVSVYYNLPISFKLQDEPMPDFSTWTYFELRDGLIAFLDDLYKDIPTSEHKMTKADVINEYTAVKCFVHFSELPDDFRAVSGNDLSKIMGEQLTPMLPYEFRKALSDHDLKLIYEIHEDSSDGIHTATIDKNIWIPENQQ